MIPALVAHAVILDNLHLLRDSARQQKLNEEQKRELFVVVKTMPEDGFDWGAAWGPIAWLGWGERFWLR